MHSVARQKYEEKIVRKLTLILFERYIVAGQISDPSSDHCHSCGHISKTKHDRPYYYGLFHTMEHYIEVGIVDSVAAAEFRFTPRGDIK